MQHFEPARGRALERAALESQQRLGFRAGEDLVSRDVPVPDHVSCTSERERAALDIGDDAAGDAAGEGVLHYGEPDQHHDQDKAAEQCRTNYVVRDQPRDRKRRGNGPHRKQQPGGNQQDRAVKAVMGQIDHEPEAENRDSEERDARDARCDRRLE